MGTVYCNTNYIIFTSIQNLVRHDKLLGDRNKNGDKFKRYLLIN